MTVSQDLRQDRKGLSRLTRISNVRSEDPPFLTVRTLEVTHLKCFHSASLAGLEHITILIGPNNIGKSALLVGLRRLTRLTDECVPILGSRDGVGTTRDIHSFRTRPGDISDSASEGMLNLLVEINDATPLFAAEFHVQDPEMAQPASFKLQIALDRNAEIKMHQSDLIELTNKFDTRLSRINRPNGSSVNCIHFGVRAANALASQIIYVPGEREIARSLESDEYSSHQERRFSGKDAVRRLIQWHLKGEVHRIEAVQEFVSAVIGTRVKLRATLDPSLEASIGETRWRDVSHLGSGLSHLIVIAMATQLTTKPILLLEEPELSLHPRLQRRLILTLVGFTHQAFITTHSNHILDSMSPNTRLFRVNRNADNTTSVVQPIEAQVIETLRDIGARPGSLAEANAVLWVEGPSDAIYLRHWLSGVQRPGAYVEGVDYVFAFHAGSLLTHSTGVRENKSLSVLGEINPNYFLILDQDPNEDGELSHRYTQRWLNHPTAWITEPKEIEGYTSDNGLCSATDNRSSNESRQPRTTDTNRSLRDRLVALGLSKSWSKNKVGLARAVVALSQKGFDILHPAHSKHLSESLERIAQFLNRCRADDPSVQPPGDGAPESHSERLSSPADHVT